MSGQVFDGELWLDRARWKALGVDKQQQQWYDQRNKFATDVNNFLQQLSKFIEDTNLLHSKQKNEDPTRHEENAQYYSDIFMEKYHALISEFRHLSPLLHNTLCKNSNAHDRFTVYHGDSIFI